MEHSRLLGGIAECGGDGRQDMSIKQAWKRLSAAMYTRYASMRVLCDML